jgi:hypothetical protein
MRRQERSVGCRLKESFDIRLCSPRWPGQRRSAGCCEEAGRAAGNRQAQLAPGHALASLLALNGLPVAGPGRKIMPDITPQLLTLLGVAVGAAASYLAGAATERTRWRREQSSRWDEKRAQAYSEYGYAVKNVYVQCLRIANSRLQNSAGDSAGHAEALAQLGALTDERTAKWETVLLLGSPQAITAARICIAASGRWSCSPGASARMSMSTTPSCRKSSPTGHASTRRPGVIWALKAVQSPSAAHGTRRCMLVRITNPGGHTRQQLMRARH